MKTKFLLMLLVLVLGVAGNAWADVNWTNAGVARAWSDPNNWWDTVALTARVPTSADKTTIKNSGDGPIIDSSTTALAGWTVCGDGGNGAIDITGGSFTMSGNFELAYYAADEATLNISGGATTVGSGKDMTAGRDGTCNVIMTNGSFTVSDDMFVARNGVSTGNMTLEDGTFTVNDQMEFGNDGTGTLTMSGGLLSVGNDLQLGDNSSGKGIITMTGGTITVADYMKIGDNGTGELTMSDGSLTIGGILYLAEDGTGSLTISGGSITVSGPLTIGRNDGSSGDLFLDGGTISCSGLEMKHGGGNSHAAIDITGGTLIIDGDAGGNVNTWIDNGWITAYGGASGWKVKVDYNTANPGKTTVTAIVVPKYLYPEKGQAVPQGDVELSWINIDPNTPGDDVFVDVWFGTDPNKPDDPRYTKVVDAKTLAGKNATSVIIPYPGPGIYYWQVDSYIYGSPNDEPNMIEGPVYWFTFDAPPSVDAGISMITWSGQAVPLAATIVDDGMSDLSILWTATSNVADVTVDYDPSEFVEDPIVTITKDFSAIPIVNAGFEDPVWTDGNWGYERPGWGVINNVDGQSTGTWNPDPDGAVYYGYNGVTPEGRNVGWATGDPSGDVGLAQVLTETLAPDTTYTLSVYVGHNYYAGLTGYKVQLLAGGTPGDTGTITVGNLLAEDSSVTITKDTFELSTVTHTSGGVTDPNVGLPLQIRLLASGGGGEADFDDLRLTSTTDRPHSSAVTTVELTLAVSDDFGSDSDTLTIDVYDNACQAAIGSGLMIDPTDIDENCITDLRDLAAMLATWLDDLALTAPVHKP